MPTQIRLEETRPRMLLVHGSPRKINEYLYDDRPVATFERIAELAGTSVLLFGHTHLPYQKSGVETLFVNCGNVGTPRRRHAVWLRAGDPGKAYSGVVSQSRLRRSGRGKGRPAGTPARALRRSSEKRRSGVGLKP